MTERMIEANGVELCTESFGDAADPPILLVMGLGASMLWWEEDFCGMLAAGKRFVIRYDHRDTGRSVTYEPGRPPYSAADLLTDAVAVLDAYGIAAAHVVGVSAGGALAQRLALDYPDRVRSLILISTSPAAPTGRALPPPTDEFGRFVGAAGPDWSDAASVIDYRVDYARLLAGGMRVFDEPAARALVRREAERARDLAALQNHSMIAGDDRPRAGLSAIAAATVVIHGGADPMFPIEHGQALAEAIPHASLLVLDDAGHGVAGPDWQVIARTILDRTGAEET
jgi:pimeloyl-ACP methyl ester carboxylesterase